MTPYLAVSAALHGALLALALWTGGRERPPQYYTVQFLGGQSGLGPGRLEPAPAPAPATAAASPAEEKKPSTAESPKDLAPDEKRPDVSKEKKPAAAKDKRASDKKPAPKAKPADKGGQPGGRGESPKGKGDIGGAAEGAVGGVGTSLEIGGFGPGGGAAQNNFPYSWYVDMIYRRLWQNWDRSQARTQECTVAFTIAKDGALQNLKVKSPSGDGLFDLLARRAVELTAPFPPLPDGFDEPTLPVLVRFRLQ